MAKITKTQLKGLSELKISTSSSSDKITASEVREVIESMVDSLKHEDAKATITDIDATGTPSATTFLRGDGVWTTPAGVGGFTQEEIEDLVNDLLVGGTGVVKSYDDANASLTISVEPSIITKLNNITATAAVNLDTLKVDVVANTNKTSYPTADSDKVANLPADQNAVNTSVQTDLGNKLEPGNLKTVDGQSIVGSGNITISGYTDEEAQDAVGSILTDSSEIDFTYDDATPTISASIVAASIDEAKLDASVNASLDLADSATQPGDNLSDFTNDSGFTDDTTVDAHISDATDAHDASAISVDETNLNSFVGSNVQEIIEFADLGFTNARSTGLGSGGDFTDQGSGVARISSGAGSIINNPNYDQVTWVQTDLDLSASDNVYYIYVDNTGTVLSTTTKPENSDYRTSIWLWALSVRGGVIVGSLPITQPIQQVAAQIHDIFDAVGTKKTGLALSSVTTNLTFSYSAGAAYFSGSNFFNDATDPHRISISAQSPVTFQHVGQNNDRSADTTVLDVGNYDNGGTVTAIPGSSTRAGIFQVHLSPNSLNVRVMRSQEWFSNLGEAFSELQSGTYSPIVPQQVQDNTILIGWIIAEKAATDLSDGDQIFITSNRDGTVGGSIATSGANALLAINNLSDINNISSARTNLGLGSAATSNLIDDDTFATASATTAASSESVKAYVDANSGGGSGDVTAASNITDNVLLRGDGGAKGVQGSQITNSDTGALGNILEANFTDGSGITSKLNYNELNFNRDGASYININDVAGVLAIRSKDLSDTITNRITLTSGTDVADVEVRESRLFASSLTGGRIASDRDVAFSGNGVTARNTDGSVGVRDTFGAGVDRSVVGTVYNIGFYPSQQFGGTKVESFRFYIDKLYAMQPFKPKNYTTALRDAIPSPENGFIINNTDAVKLQMYEDGAWVSLARDPLIVGLTSDRNIASTDVHNIIACTTSATLTITLNFSAMQVGERIELEAHGTILTLASVAGVTINGTDTASIPLGNGSAWVGGILRKTGTNSYVHF